MVCQYCGKEAELVGGDRIYPHRKDLYEKKFYLCEPCGARCGTHKDGIPLGTLANAELRSLRMMAHKEFDKHWKGKKGLRKHLYRDLQNQMKLSAEDAHIGKMNENQCRRVIEIYKKKNGSKS